MTNIIFFIGHKYRYIAHKKAQERLFLNIMIINVTFRGFIGSYKMLKCHNGIKHC